MRTDFSRVGIGFTCCVAALAGCIGNMDLSPAAADDEAVTQVAAEIQVTNTAEQAVETEPAGRAAPVCASASEPANPMHNAMFAALNDYRQENGLPPLIYSNRLEAAAESQVRDLWERGFFAHVNPDGKDPGARAVAAGFCHHYVGENIAAGQATVEKVMRAWKNSPGHNQNMLEPLYVYVGVSHSVDAKGRHYWGQEFAYELP